MGAIQLSPRTCIATGAALSTGLSHPDTLDASTGILHPSMVGYSADWIPHVFITGTRRANFGFGFGLILVSITVAGRRPVGGETVVPVWERSLLHNTVEAQIILRIPNSVGYVVNRRIHVP